MTMDPESRKLGLRDEPLSPGEFWRTAQKQFYEDFRKGWVSASHHRIMEHYRLQELFAHELR